MKSIMAKKNKGRSYLAKVAAAIMVFLAATPAWGAESDYKNRADINLSKVESDYNILELPDEVIAQSQPGLADLRIYSGGSEIPYGLLRNPLETRSGKYEPAEMLNLGKDSQGNLVFEVKVPQDRWITQIKLASTDRDFIRAVKIEGSMDRNEWRLLTSDSTIFDLSGEGKSRNLEVNLPPTNFSYLRVSLLQGGKGEFKPESLELLMDEADIVFPLKERDYELLEENGGAGIQEFIVDLRLPRLQVSELELVTAAENFSRAAEIYESSDGEKWEHAADAEIFVYSLDRLTARQLIIKCSTSQRYLKLLIHNNDNPELSVSDVKIRGLNPLLVFPAESPSGYVLYWNSSQVKAPVYDIEKFKMNLDYRGTPRASLGELEENKDFVFRDTRPWTERNDWLLKVSVIGAAAVLMLVIARSIQKISKDSS
ncbi:hypothetical protein EAL2_808p05550 (plasmid) [Peptoclostridium acidaminophilum DSM 3953]|uniref:F5/8 type C domain-containing protein n=1 Tax=Peptoclostridium acidaminophilum DSM 3953 TaxID=1286171 RepID=W8TJW9_PEPAC|nr:hypothetical protein [Peptoclostridium acidaminophilum]AHM58058.1 hypothetical protein EAL2_808p05550 [Peptoclostridium acidaminophilum DSM 3953]